MRVSTSSRGWRGGLAAILAMAVAAPAVAADLDDYPEVSVDVALERVSEHVWYVPGMAGAATEHEGFISNAGVIVGEDAVAVVDALGTPSLAAEMLRAIRAITDKPVRYAITTHYHADHIYGLQVFTDHEDAEVYAPEGVHSYLASDNTANLLRDRRNTLYPWVNEETRLVEPDHVVDGRETIDLGGITVRMDYAGPAHSEGDMTVWVEEDRTFFAGDLIFEGRVPWLGDANTGNWLELLQEMDGTDVEGLVPGHGPQARRPNEALTLTRRYIAEVRRVMEEAVENFMSFEEAYEAADWSEFEDLPAFDQAHRRNAYRVYLEVENEAF
ncbi:MAG: MBL fold metallo-hydrolase [Pseudomonadota bacterium]